MLLKAVETGLSDFHRMVSTFLRNTYSRQKPIKLFCHDYSNFDNAKFLEDFVELNYTTYPNHKMILMVNIII